MPIYSALSTEYILDSDADDEPSAENDAETAEQYNDDDDEYGHMEYQENEGSYQGAGSDDRVGHNQDEVFVQSGIDSPVSCLIGEKYEENHQDDDDGYGVHSNEKYGGGDYDEVCIESGPRRSRLTRAA